MNEMEEERQRLMSEYLAMAQMYCMTWPIVMANANRELHALSAAGVAMSAVQELRKFVLIARTMSNLELRKIVEDHEGFYEAVEKTERLEP